MIHQKPNFQWIVGCTPTNVPLWEIPIYIYKPYNTWVFMGYNPQESLGRIQ